MAASRSSRSRRAQRRPTTPSYRARYHSPLGCRWSVPSVCLPRGVPEKLHIELDERLVAVDRDAFVCAVETAQVLACQNHRKKSVRGLGDVLEVSAICPGYHQSGGNDSAGKDLSHGPRQRTETCRARGRRCDGLLTLESLDADLIVADDAPNVLQDAVGRLARQNTGVNDRRRRGREDVVYRSAFGD